MAQPKQLTELFGKSKGTISEHIKHIFADGELGEDSVVRFFRTTATDGKSYEVAYYNLDMVLALGYRVRSTVGVRFRQWASTQIKEFIIKGFVLDDDRLKNPAKGHDYFDELTRRLQDIRTSERRFYQKITDSGVAACLNLTGPGLGAVATTFVTVSDTGIWILSFAMLLGRLEVFTLLVILSPAFWRK